MTLEHALEQTRDRWNAYINRTTPWPADNAGRKAAIEERLAITEERIGLCDPRDKRRADLQREANSDRESLRLLSQRDY